MLGDQKHSITNHVVIEFVLVIVGSITEKKFVAIGLAIKKIRLLQAW
jgi:hypothetical protein